MKYTAKHTTAHPHPP